MNSNTIFQKGSKTFYTASLFFPEHIRKNVVKLYAFVRIADDFVDQIPQDKQGFMRFKKQTNDAFTKETLTNNVISEFVDLCRECDIDKQWVDSFLQAMEQDLRKRKYLTYEELEAYMYGSAEVIGLMMARIMDLPKKSENAARLQGRALQLINFIRDVREDSELGRQYIPQQDLRKFGITKLTPQVDEEAFRQLVTFEVDRFRKLQAVAKKGYRYIPRAKRIPIATATALYEWTADEIQKDPMKVFQKKIKPSKLRIFTEYVKLSLTI